MGRIQGIEVYDEGQLRSIWFIQERVGHINIEDIKRRDFKISAILTEYGFQINDPEQFNLGLKELLHEIGEEKGSKKRG